MSDLNKEKYNTFFVTTSQDSVPGSLRDAINQANLSSNLFSKIIIKPLCSHIIQLTDGEIVISSNIKLINATGNELTIKASTGPVSRDNNRLFHVILPSIYFKIISPCHKLILSDGSASTNGGAILVEPTNHTLILKNVIITKNVSKRAGGGIYTRGNVNLILSEVTANMANTQGGGIWSEGNTILSESSVSKNIVLVIRESNGGGGIFVDNGNCVLDKSHVVHNLVAYNLLGGGSGGGIVVMNGSVFVQNNSHVDHNTAYNSGGIQECIGNVNVTNKSSVSFNKSFSSNIAAGGGAITLTMGIVNVSDSKIHANETLGMFSGGIVSLVGDVIVTDHSEISKNLNKGPGGGIAVNIGSVVVNNSNISNNIGASLGGGIVCFTPSPNYVVVTKSNINGNILTNAQTIKQTIEAFLEVISGYLLSTSILATESGGPGSKAYIQLIPIILAKTKEINDQLKALPSSMITNGNTIAGGAIACLLSASIIVDDSLVGCNFVGKNVNQTNEPVEPFNALAGGIFGFLTKIKINSSIVKNNVSIDDAGGIFSKTELFLSHSKVIDNKTKKGNGGGILNDDAGKTIVIDSIISGNLAGQNGGGINNRGSLELIDTTITLNGAKNSGGGVFSFGPFIKINTKIINNYPNNVIIIPHARRRV
jgi:hypothetical protein